MGLLPLEKHEVQTLRIHGNRTEWSPLHSQCVIALLALLEREEKLLFHRNPTWCQLQSTLEACKYLVDLVCLHAATCLQFSQGQSCIGQLLTAAIALQDAISQWLSEQEEDCIAKELTISQRCAWIKSRIQLISEAASYHQSRNEYKEAVILVYKHLELEYSLLKLVLEDSVKFTDVIHYRTDIAKAHFKLCFLCDILKDHSTAALHAKSSASILFELLLDVVKVPYLQTNERNELVWLLVRALHNFSIEQDILNFGTEAIQACRKSYELSIACFGKDHEKTNCIVQHYDNLNHPCYGRQPHTPLQLTQTDRWRIPRVWKSLLRSFGYCTTIPDRPVIKVKKCKPIPVESPRPAKPLKPEGAVLVGCTSPRLVQFGPILHKNALIEPIPLVANVERPKSAAATAPIKRPLIPASFSPRPHTVSSMHGRNLAPSRLATNLLKSNVRKKTKAVAFQLVITQDTESTIKNVVIAPVSVYDTVDKEISECCRALIDSIVQENQDEG
ncbi:hypothetical protein THRCLA_06276 [Thraustotheca clavata]|uniref:Uncharacterized protein n=1 Tax=Thraustotheca clavata TaxID=74557 RepID=A0A1V9ZPX7_9STRA|nr:hypothetical protein THRCLA_06276 [Thraustotheca clavata]